MRACRALLALIAGLQAGALSAQDAAEAPPGTIVLCWSEGAEGLVARVRAELRAADVRVVERRGEPPSDPAALAREHHADGVIAVAAGGRRIEIWVARAAGTAVSARDVLVADGAHTDDAVLALRVTETLRARGLELPRRAAPAPGSSATETAAAPVPAAEPAAEAEPAAAAGDHGAGEPDAGATQAPSSEPSAPPASRAPEPIAISADVEPRSEFRPPPLALWLELAPAAVASPGGLDPSMQVFVSARVQLAGLVSAAAFGALPVLGAHADAPEGTARVASTLFGGAVDGSFEQRDFALSLGAGLAGVINAVEGTARPPYESARETERSLIAFGRAGAHVRLLGSLRVCARVAVGAAFPRLTVRFAERDVADWGRPLWLATLGLELPIPLPIDR